MKRKEGSQIRGPSLAFLSHRSQNLLIFFFSRRMRRTLWLMRTSPAPVGFTSRGTCLALIEMLE